MLSVKNKDMYVECKFAGSSNPQILKKKKYAEIMNSNAQMCMR